MEKDQRFDRVPADSASPRDGCATTRPVVTIDSVTLVPAAWDIPGPVDVVAALTDGTNVTLFRYFPDEISFTSSDFVGRTVEEARALRHKRDVDWLTW